MKLLEFLYFVPFIAFGTVANLLIKTGVSRIHLAKVLSFESFVVMVTSPYILGGLLCYGAGFVSFVYLLYKFPLNIVQTFSALAFVTVILASRFILDEPISALRWAGIATVFIGLILVGRSI